MVIKKLQQRERTRYTNAGTVTQRENFMKSMILVGLMMVILTACTSKFDGFDPTTATVRWMLKQNFSVEKDEPHAANATR